MRFFDRDYPRFNFPGFHSTGTCFLRARVTSSGLTVLCTQLLGYNGTSVTNACEAVLMAALDQVDQDIGLDALVPKQRWSPFRRNRAEIIQAVMGNLSWIEHYPKGATAANHETFALVTFDDMRPSWEYLDPLKIATRCGVEPGFLYVDPTDLVFRR
jgi:hypothetical protein